MPLRARNAVILAKIESTVGTDAAPAAATDAILAENVQVDPQVGIIETDEHTGSLDSDGPIVSGIRGRIAFSTLFKGSGAAGTAPEWGKLLRACGWAETVTAAAVGTPTAATAGTATTVTAAAPFAATVDLYRGMPLTLTGNPAAGDTTLITDYTVGRVATLMDTYSPVLDTSTLLQIPINVRYAPATASIPSLTIWVYHDGLLYKFVGCRGDFSLSLDAGGIGRIAWTFKGVFASKTDAAVVSPTLDTTRPPVWRGGKMRINRVSSAVAQFTLSPNATMPMPGDPNAAEGFSYPIHTRRSLQGSVNPLEELVATRDIMTAFRAGTRQTMGLTLGTTAGNRLGIVMPQAHYRGQTPANRDDVLAVGVPFSAVGKDSGAFISVW